MKPLRLSLLATACAFAITACSSNGSPSRYPEPVKKEEKSAQQAKQEAETKLASKEAELATKEAELAKKENALAALIQQKTALEAQLKGATAERNALATKEQQLTQQLADVQKENATLAQKDKVSEADKTALAQRNSELATQKSALDEQKKALESQKSALEDKIKQLEQEKSSLASELALTKPIIAEVEKEKADKLRLEKNKAEIKKGFADNGVDDTKLSYVSGAMVAVEGDKLTYQAVAEKSQNLNALVVDGKTVTLFSTDQILARQENYENETHNLDEIRTEGLTGKVGSLPKRKIGDDFAQMRFGYVTDNSGKTTLFVQGHQTPTTESVDSPFSYYRAGQAGEKEIMRPMPTAGRFEYQGNAFYGKANNYAQFGVTALADFDNKKVKVDLTQEDKTKLTFGGQIEGNGFAGNYQGVEAKGAFYGTNGQDIGGVFYQTQGTEKDYNGVFGATKRDCGWQGCEQPAQDLKTFEVTK